MVTTVNSTIRIKETIIHTRDPMLFHNFPNIISSR